ncbi:hypothetical protein [Paenibacillus sp. Soil787]|uniref:hypothetical protein n=1 Tax=Paenibacillus sp. Soil787 TaxID=1736411 RepID=UPI0006F1DBB7|nr:hypothetical protein [Paenibacillus sp. Soil787]KRF31682.1 hypothetical protein ASG93_04920 [Paenibacillus sp. Soil787]
MLNKDSVIVPDISNLEEILSSRSGYILNNNLDPNLRFEIYNEKNNSRVICSMTADHALFSIDIRNAEDKELLEILEFVLTKYNLETDQLVEDIYKCYKRRINEFQTDYERFWVIYRYHKEINGVLVRYRAFVND